MSRRPIEGSKRNRSDGRAWKTHTSLKNSNFYADGLLPGRWCLGGASCPYDTRRITSMKHVNSICQSKRCAANPKLTINFAGQIIQVKIGSSHVVMQKVSVELAENISAMDWQISLFGLDTLRSKGAYQGSPEPPWCKLR